VSLFLRNINKYGKTISIQSRDITPPAYGETVFEESFSGAISAKAIIKTPKGKTFFDGVNLERPITHEFHVRYVSGTVDDDTVTQENWILYKGRRIDILDVKNCCEDDNKLILTCTDRGTKQASFI